MPTNTSCHELIFSTLRDIVATRRRMGVLVTSRQEATDALLEVPEIAALAQERSLEVGSTAKQWIANQVDWFHARWPGTPHHHGLTRSRVGKYWAIDLRPETEPHATTSEASAAAVDGPAVERTEPTEWTFIEEIGNLLLNIHLAAKKNPDMLAAPAYVGDGPRLAPHTWRTYVETATQAELHDSKTTDFVAWCGAFLDAMAAGRAA